MNWMHDTYCHGVGYQQHYHEFNSITIHAGAMLYLLLFHHLRFYAYYIANCISTVLVYY